MIPAIAGAEDGEDKKLAVTTSFSDDLEIRYWSVPERLPGFEDRQVLNYVEQVNRFTARAQAGRWGFNAQIDEVAFEYELGACTEEVDLGWWRLPKGALGASLMRFKGLVGGDILYQTRLK